MKTRMYAVSAVKGLIRVQHTVLYQWQCCTVYLNHNYDIIIFMLYYRRETPGSASQVQVHGGVSLAGSQIGRAPGWNHTSSPAGTETHPPSRTSPNLRLYPESRLEPVPQSVPAQHEQTQRQFAAALIQTKCVETVFGYLWITG